MVMNPNRTSYSPFVSSVPTSTYLLSGSAGACFLGENHLKEKTRELARPETLFAALTLTLKQFVAFEMASIAEVESVFALREGNLWYINTIVPDFDPLVDKKIFQKEGEVIDEFEMFNFDFNIISREGHEISELISEPPFERIYERK
jgi:hypothetical protein